MKFDTKARDAQVFRPGNYDIQVRDGERTLLAQRVYVPIGKTIHLHAAM